MPSREGVTFWLLVGAVSSVAGCPGRIEDPERFTTPECPPGTDVVTDIFTPNCGSTACHGAGAESAGSLDLLSPNLESRLVEVPSGTCIGRVRVDLSNIEESFFLEKLGLDPECGDPMPQIGVRLSRVELACVREWVEDLVEPEDGGGL